MAWRQRLVILSFIPICILAACIGYATTPRPVEPKNEIVILNDGVATPESTMLQQFLKRRFAMPVRVEKNFVDVSAAFYPDRNQYDYSVILKTVHQHVRGRKGRVLFLTAKDTFGEGLNWSTGIAYCNGTTAVVSICRLNPTFWGDSPDTKTWHERIRKIAMHELGHTFGRSEHCSNWNCAIHGSNSIADIDRTPAEYCTECHTLSRQALKKIQ